MVKMTLTDGSVFEGTMEELRQLAEVFGVAVPDGDGYDAGGDDFEVYEKSADHPKRPTVGDYVRVIAEDSGHLADIGDIVKIVRDDHDGQPYLCERVDGKAVGHLCESEVVPATAEEISEATKPDQPQFAVGDYVKVQLPDGDKPHYSWGKVSNGDVGKVTSINKYRIVVDFPSQSGWRAKPNELVKVDEKAAKWAKLGRKPNEFKQGDIVRIISAGFSGLRNGELGIVGEIDGDILRVCGRLSYANWVDSDNVELVASAESRVDVE